jgi:hypothetical protein
VSSPIAPDPKAFAAAARKPEVLIADESADAWVRSVEAYMRAQGLPLDGEQSLVLIDVVIGLEHLVHLDHLLSVKLLLV